MIHPGSVDRMTRQLTEAVRWTRLNVEYYERRITECSTAGDLGHVNDCLVPSLAQRELRLQEAEEDLETLRTLLALRG